ncbi:MAG: hypothetical protein QM780_09740 [Hyphomicrobium sp.]|uniref:hypothetical protein n=1 Tax=Hyphomicrobium sp. TaxID=82 RepID=UPI0039E25ED1
MIETTISNGEFVCAATVASACDLSLSSPLFDFAFAGSVPASIPTTTALAAIERNAGERLPLTFSERRTQPTRRQKSKTVAATPPGRNVAFELCAENWLTEAGPSTQLKCPSPTAFDVSDVAPIQRFYSGDGNICGRPVEKFTMQVVFGRPESWRDRCYFHKLCLAD